MIENNMLLSYSHLEYHVNLFKHYGAPLNSAKDIILTWLVLSALKGTITYKNDWLVISDGLPKVIKLVYPKKYFLKKFIILRTFNDRLTNWLWREELYLVNYLNGVTDDNQTNLRKTIRFVCHVFLWYFPCNTIAYFPRLFAWLRRQNDYYF